MCIVVVASNQELEKLEVDRIEWIQQHLRQYTTLRHETDMFNQGVSWKLFYLANNFSELGLGRGPSRLHFNDEYQRFDIIYPFLASQRWISAY